MIRLYAPTYYSAGGWEMNAPAPVSCYGFTPNSGEMSTDTVSVFETSLRDHGVRMIRVRESEFREKLDQVVEPPAVGAPLPFDSAVLPETVTRDPTPRELQAAKTGVTAATLGIADYGTIVLDSSLDGTEPLSLFPERHVAVLSAADVVADMETAFDRMAESMRAKRRSLILATGPSATADMGALVTGAHGPKHVDVLLLEDDT